MKRRAFLGASAAAVGGLLTGRQVQARPTKAKQSHLPRWEWEVGDWYYRYSGCNCPGGVYGNAIVNSDGEPFEPPNIERLEIRRDWRGSATIPTDDVLSISSAVSACNVEAFMASGMGCLRIGPVSLITAGDGLGECTVLLKERGMRQDGVEVMDFRCKKTSWLQMYDLVNFYDVFRGSHSATLGDEARKQLGLVR